MDADIRERLSMMLEGRAVCVTGGTGSIGSEIVRQLLKYKPSMVRILSRDEYRQALLRQEFAKYNNIRYLLGDVREVDRLRRAFDGVDTVFHAAALKRVESTEYDPPEAVKTNVLGTQNVITAALETSVRRVVNISTDKAVNVTSTMGATKLLAERLIAWASFYRRMPQKIFCSVRFGNVLDSRGSVLPLWREQIRQGGPVTLTHADMRRFFMTVPNAAQLVLEAAARAQGGEIFVMRMKAVRIQDLCEVMIEELAPKAGLKAEDIAIRIIGITPGEKLDEDLITPGEAVHAYLLSDDLGVIIPSQRVDDRPGPPIELSSGFITSNQPVSKEELRAYLREGGYV